ncbi:MAG: type II toxin-antitoxin system RelE/ParE family toxin [Alphaproteobacteria bacterium]|nr:type II toxin-antitoxin system RelE/ParE family toxin [Alphaproteobacteria bacterium]
MIRSFRDRETLPFFEGLRVSAYQGFADQAVRRLLPDSAEITGDLAALPSNRLEALRGDRAGRHGIRINAQWRVCFRWTDDGPCDVEIVDDHRGGLTRAQGTE